AHRGDLVRAELPADGHPLTVECRLLLFGVRGWGGFLAVGREDLRAVKAHGAADPRADHAEGAGGFHPAMTVDAAVHGHVICDQGLGGSPPRTEARSLQLDIMMEAGTGEVNGMRTQDMAEPEIAVELQVLRVEPGKHRAVEDQAVEPCFAHRDGFIKKASP